MAKFTYVIINGCGASGKDTFVEYCDDLVSGEVDVINYSTIDPQKKILDIVYNHYAGSCPAFGRSIANKTETYRSCLVELKEYMNRKWDLQMIDLDLTVREAINQSKDKGFLMFIHCREPENIDRIRRYLRFSIESLYSETRVRTLLIEGRTDPNSFSNSSDRNVLNYKYDDVISNKGTLSDLHDLAARYVKNVLHLTVVN